MADFDLDELEDLLDNTKYNQSRKQADEDDFFGNNDTKAKRSPPRGTENWTTSSSRLIGMLIPSPRLPLISIIGLTPSKAPLTRRKT